VRTWSSGRWASFDRAPELGDGMETDEIVAAYPELEKEDVYQAAKYAAWLASEKTSAIR